MLTTPLKIISIIVLTILNCFPIYAVIFLKWEMGSIYILYWLETYIVWLFTTIKYIIHQSHTIGFSNFKINDDPYFTLFAPVVGILTVFGIAFSYDLFRDQFLSGIFYYLSASFAIHGFLMGTQFILQKRHKNISDKVLVNIVARRGIFLFGCSFVMFVQVGINAMKDLPYGHNMNKTLLIFFISVKIIFEICEYLHESGKIKSSGT